MNNTALNVSNVSATPLTPSVRVTKRLRLNTCANSRRNTAESLQNKSEQTLLPASSPTVGMLLVAVSRQAKEAHERLQKDKGRMAVRVHRIGAGIMSKAFNESGCPLSDEEITLMHRYGREPFSWEE